jgi:hypothetical protein
MSIADWIYCPQKTKTHPFLQYRKTLHPTFSVGYALSCQEYKGSGSVFFFKLGGHRVSADFQYPAYIANAGTVLRKGCDLFFYSLFSSIIAIIQLKSFAAPVAPPALTAVFTVPVLH